MRVTKVIAIASLALLATSVTALKLSADTNFARTPGNMLVVMNPYEPSSQYQSPCSFALLSDGGVECGSEQEKDFFGLCAPCSWDCNMGEAPVDYFYEDYMPSRRAACNCYCHGSDDQTGKDLQACKRTFVVDDEMENTIAILQAVNLKTPHFIAVEVGSRQGQWVLKAVSAAKRMHAFGAPFESVYGHSFEAKSEWMERQRLKIDMNAFNDDVTIDTDLITHENYPQLIEKLTMRTGKWQPINHMDWDCQGCESVLASPKAFELYDANILSLMIAIHPRGDFDGLKQTYARDTLKLEKGNNTLCDEANTKGLRESKGLSAGAGFECLKNTFFGPMYYRDGTLRVFNQRLFNRLNLTLRLPECPPWQNA